jgi:hypothetical protein
MPAVGELPWMLAAGLRAKQPPVSHRLPQAPRFAQAKSEWWKQHEGLSAVPF